MNLSKLHEAKLPVLLLHVASLGVFVEMPMDIEQREIFLWKVRTSFDNPTRALITCQSTNRLLSTPKLENQGSPS